MKLFFKFGPDSGNNSIELELEPSDTVGTLLALLEAHTGQNVATKTFNSEGRLLAMSPEKELNSFGLRDGAIINVTEGSSGSSQTQRIPTAVSPNVGASAAKSKRKGPSRLSAQVRIRCCNLAYASNLLAGYYCICKVTAQCTPRHE